MKKLLIILGLLIWGSPVLADQWVSGHWRDTNNDGVKDTYVMPYWRSTPDGNPFNNWSTKGNINPYTGQKGYIDPYNLYNYPSKKKYGW